MWSGRSYRVSLPYSSLAVASTYLTASSFANFYLHFEDVNWFKSLVDLSMTLGTNLLCIMHTKNGQEIDKLSYQVDQWWSYSYLEPEIAQVKADVRKKLSAVISYFSGCK